MLEPDNREEDWQNNAGKLFHPGKEGKLIMYGVYVGINHPAYKEVCEIMKKYKNTNKGG